MIRRVWVLVVRIRSSVWVLTVKRRILVLLVRRRRVDSAGSEEEENLGVALERCFTPPQAMTQSAPNS